MLACVRIHHQGKRASNGSPTTLNNVLFLDPNMTIYHNKSGRANTVRYLRVLAGNKDLTQIDTSVLLMGGMQFIVYVDRVTNNVVLNKVKS